MPSKISPFEFLRKYQTPKDGACVYVISDPFIETFFKNRLKENINFDLISGPDLNRNFLEERYLNLSLFSEASNVLALNGEAINDKTLTFWLQAQLVVHNQLLVILSSKDLKIFSKLEEKKLINLTIVEAPKFWEGAKILDTVLQELSYEMSSVYKEMLLEKVENSFAEFHQIIIKLKLMRPEGLKFDRESHQANLLFLNENVEESKVDFFKLIDLINQSPRKFFYNIQKSDRDYDYYRSLAVFMQGHFQKSKFPSLVKEKSKLTQYDRQILQTNESFSETERAELESVFSEMEILAKLKSDYLKPFIRLKCMP